jgi:hypothetical protein
MISQNLSGHFHESNAMNSMFRSALTVVAGVALLLLPSFVFAQAPQFVPIQGSLYDDTGEPINETLPVEFVLYGDTSRSTVLYSETAFVIFEGGYFTEYLGPINLETFDSRGSLYLGMNVNGDGEMALIRVGTVPFAAFADYCGDSNTLGGQTTAQIQSATVESLGPLSNDNPYRHNRYTDAEARAAMGPISNDNPYAHNRYTDAEAVGAMGPRANSNPLHHDRYTDAEARAAMGPISNDNPYAHNRYTDAEAVGAMGPVINSNPYAHSRYTDDEARAANNGRFSSTTHEHIPQDCLWEDWGCGARLCRAGYFMAGMEAWPGAAEQCFGSGDFDEPSRRVYCCRMSDPRD